eukprot:scaffold51787_cov30-Tisochrysis_lutea.AAC.1
MMKIRGSDGGCGYGTKLALFLLPFPPFRASFTNVFVSMWTRRQSTTNYADVKLVLAFTHTLLEPRALKEKHLGHLRPRPRRALLLAHATVHPSLTLLPLSPKEEEHLVNHIFLKYY